jgi:hypothetical protein
MASSEPTVEELIFHIKNLYLAIDTLMWDYHWRHHKDDGDIREYKSCIHYPCNILSLYILNKKPKDDNE